jgi:hypothetical protein
LEHPPSGSPEDDLWAALAALFFTGKREFRFVLGLWAKTIPLPGFDFAAWGRLEKIGPAAKRLMIGLRPTDLWSVLNKII